MMSSISESVCFEMSSSTPPFDLHRLRVLRAVARERSFSAAARALDYTQPAIGHHIRRLEAELGTPLVIRRGRTIDLTPAGEALVARADSLLAGASAAWEEVAAVAGLRAGRVRLATFPSAGATFVPPALALLRDAHPGLEVTLVEDEPPELGAARAARRGRPGGELRVRRRRRRAGARAHRAVPGGEARGPVGGPSAGRRARDRPRRSCATRGSSAVARVAAAIWWRSAVRRASSRTSGSPPTTGSRCRRWSRPGSG